MEELETRIINKAFLINKNGEVLVIKRSSTDDIRPDEWDLPGGRHEDGESLENGVTREIEEETGVNSLDGLKLMFTHSELRTSEGPAFRYILLIFTARVDNPNIVVSDEHSEYKWVSKQELSDILPHPLHKLATEFIFG